MKNTIANPKIDLTPFAMPPSFSEVYVGPLDEDGTVPEDNDIYDADEGVDLMVGDSTFAVLNAEKQAKWLDSFRQWAAESACDEYIPALPSGVFIFDGPEGASFVIATGDYELAERFSDFCDQEGVPRHFMVDSLDITDVAPQVPRLTDTELAQKINTGSDDDDFALLRILASLQVPSG